MKQRLTLLDIKAAVNELDERLRGVFIQNFYSTQQRFIYIKLSNKDTLLLEPGYRLHLTQTCGSEISHFCKKLREKCRRARIHSMCTFGFDRIVIIDIQRYRIVVEFFSAGNIIIIDEADMIVEVLRPVPELGIVKNSKYVFNRVTLDLTFEGFRDASDLGSFLPLEREYVDVCRVALEKRFEASVEDLKREEYRKGITGWLQELLNGIDRIGYFGEVTLRKGKPYDLFSFKTTTEGSYELKDSGEVEGVKEADAREEDAIKQKLESLSIGRRGEVELRSKEEIDRQVAKKGSVRAVHFSSFNEAAEYYFSDAGKKKPVKEDKATRIRKAQERYIEELETVVEGNQDTAQVLERNKAFVGEILEIFKRVLKTRMDWEAFEVFWDEEKRKGNRHATGIVSFDFDAKKCVVSVEDRYVELDITKTLSKNIEAYYVKRRKAIDKGERTKIALENIVEKMVPKKVVVPAQKREAYWFEKFHFLISTGGELVIGGRNADQNEAVVKKYMEEGDLYFHCDVHGASSVVSKGRKDVTIHEASIMSLCMSKCWDERVVKEVFYVEPSQVSKTAPSGEYVSKGSFVIRGKKTALNPCQFEYGVGVLFKVEGRSEWLGFTSNPAEEEKILHAMPMAGPWITVRNYKYKVKVCPGGEKKTKMCQEIKEIFDKMAEGSREEVAVKCIGEMEYMNVVPGKSRIPKSSRQ